MKNVILYSTGCPKCKVLEAKMNTKNIDYAVIDDTDLMIRKGFMSLPMLEVDGEVMDFINAVKWINGIGES